MRFKIGDSKIYEGGAINELSLKLILRLERETALLGRPLRMNDVKTWSDELDALPTVAEKEAYPNGPWLLAVTIWASRNLSGETVTFEEAIDFPLSQLAYLPDPQDRLPANPQKARPASGRAGKQAPALSASTVTSKGQ